MPWLSLWQPILTFVTLLFLVLPSQRLSRPWQLGLLAGLIALALLPIDGIGLSIYLRSIIDDLAITTLLVLSIATLVRLRLLAAPSMRQQTELLCVFTALALFLYPATLGLTYFDPYRLGYSPRSMLVVIGVLTLVLLWRRNLLGVLLLSTATLAFTFQLKQSGNYWDYLIDPGLGAWAMGVLLLRTAQPFIPARYRKA
ncbi:MAG: hypothetical protein V4751_03265 [Pseudomonadota bacterium]